MRVKRFKIENGKDICSIGMSGIGSYIRFHLPLTVVWYDCRGSIARYLAALPYNEEYRNAIGEVFKGSLNIDYTNDIESLYNVIEPLLPLFKNGKYSLSFNANTKGESFQYTSPQFEGVQYLPLEIAFASESTSIDEQQEIKKKYEKRSDIVFYTTTTVYPGDDSFYATQPYNEIDEDRVAYFEEKIKNGERPFALLFIADYSPRDYYSSTFILDGHHKLLAYQKLKIYPPLAFLTYYPENEDQLEFDVDKLSKVLYPWQVKHILDNAGEDDFFVKENS